MSLLDLIKRISMETNDSDILIGECIDKKGSIKINDKFILSIEDMIVPESMYIDVKDKVIILYLNKTYLLFNKLGK